jgi:hypothetical protein
LNQRSFDEKEKEQCMKEVDALNIILPRFSTKSGTAASQSPMVQVNGMFYNVLVKDASKATMTQMYVGISLKGTMTAAIEKAVNFSEKIDFGKFKKEESKQVVHVSEGNASVQFLDYDVVTFGSPSQWLVCQIYIRGLPLHNKDFYEIFSKKLAAGVHAYGPNKRVELQFRYPTPIPAIVNIDNSIRLLEGASSSAFNSQRTSSEVLALRRLMNSDVNAVNHYCGLEGKEVKINIPLPENISNKVPWHYAYVYTVGLLIYFPLQNEEIKITNNTVSSFSSFAGLAPAVAIKACAGSDESPPFNPLTTKEDYKNELRRKDTVCPMCEKTFKKDNEDDDPSKVLVVKCDVKECRRRYHKECVKHWIECRVAHNDCDEKDIDRSDWMFSGTSNLWFFCPRCVFCHSPDCKMPPVSHSRALKKRSDGSSKYNPGFQCTQCAIQYHSECVQCSTVNPSVKICSYCASELMATGE